MTTISLAEWQQSPDILVGENEHRRLTIAAMTDVGQPADQMDFLLYELDRAQVVRDAQLPPDVVRLGSIVRYKPLPGEERTIKLVLPEAAERGDAYRLSVTSAHGAALLGLRPGHVISCNGPDGVPLRLKVLKVANSGPAGDPGPLSA
jgi:regulator of nucleoside diphosphate kinase